VEICVDAAQSRAARGLLNWSQSDLVEHSGVSKKTIADFERGTTKPYGRTLTAIIAAYEAAGIEFINRGVRLRASPKRAQPTHA
jgi:transcriptional regulator with XRE-family HTH domain